MITEEENERQETRAAYEQWILNETCLALEIERKFSDYRDDVLDCSFEAWKKMDVPERPTWS